MGCFPSDLHQLQITILWNVGCFRKLWWPTLFIVWNIGTKDVSMPMESTCRENTIENCTNPYVSFNSVFEFVMFCHNKLAQERQCRKIHCYKAALISKRYGFCFTCLFVCKSPSIDLEALSRRPLSGVRAGNSNLAKSRLCPRKSTHRLLNLQTAKSHWFCLILGFSIYRKRSRF